MAGARVRGDARAGRGARAGDVGADAALALPPRHLARGLPADRSAARRQEILAEMEPEAELALRREAVITAVVAAEGIDPSERGAARGARADRRARGDRAAEAARASCARAGRLEEVREDLAAREAIDLIAGCREADPARAGAGARAAVDTREGRGGAPAARAGEPASAPARLWTPDRSRTGQLASLEESGRRGETKARTMRRKRGQ